MFRRFKRHLKEGILGVFRHAGLSFSSISAVMITLLLISLFLIITTNLQKVSEKIEGSLKISVLVKYENESEADLKRIREEISKIYGVVNITHHTKEEEYQYYIDTYFEEQKELFKSYEDSNPFHESFMVEIQDARMLEEISVHILGIEGVFDTNYGGVSSRKLVEILNNIRIIGLALVISLCSLAIYLVYNTIKITISARADEIWIMRNVGARNGYVTAPFLVEGVIIGIIGSLIPVLLTIFGYIYLYKQTEGYIISELFSLIQPLPYVIELSLILVGTGILVGFVGSFLSVNKYLRLRR